MTSARTAVYAASFDPITNGHLDLVQRASRLFDELIVVLARNVDKKGLFSIEERIEMIREVVKPYENVRVDVTDTLLVEYARSQGAGIIVRGLRALSDFEYEFEMALMNSHLCPDLETVFLMTSERWFYVSSSRLREIVSFGGDVSEFVPEGVDKRLREKLGPKGGGRAGPRSR